MRRFETLIQARELFNLLKGPAPVYLVEAGFNSSEAYFAEHIPTARYFDLAEISNLSGPSPPMLPTEDVFNLNMQRLGLPNDSHQLVCYDRGGLIYASRAWWTFKVFGRKHIAVLDGGLPLWLEEGLATESGVEGKPAETFTAYSANKSFLKEFPEVSILSYLLSMKPPQSLTQILDARPPSVFAGLRSAAAISNIPGSKNLFYKKLLADNGCLKSPEEIVKEFEGVGVNLQEHSHTVHTCVSGMSACVSMLAMSHIGKTNCSVYDGSWNEYSQLIEAQAAPSKTKS